MAEVLHIQSLNRTFFIQTPFSTKCPSSVSLISFRIAINGNPDLKWKALREELKCQGRYSCFFDDGSKQEEARKALETALGGKKTEFERWDKEIQKREEIGGGDAGGRGCWFGGGGWFGGFVGGHFRDEAQQAGLAMIGIISLYLLLIKGNVLFAIISNSMLFLLRGFRYVFAFLSACFSGRSGLTRAVAALLPQLTAKEREMRKW